jgi:hypothetical protein
MVSAKKKKEITLLFSNALARYCIPSVVKALFLNLSVFNTFGKKNQFGKSTEISLPCRFVMQLRDIVLLDL